MAKLINYQYLRLEVDISQNVQDAELDNPIKRAQEMLEMLIGSPLYTELDGQSPNFLDANITLMPYVKKFLAWQAYQFWLVKANLKSHNSGIRVHREDNSEPATDAQLAMLIKDAKNWAETQQQKLLEYLKLNATSYPLFVVDCTDRKRATGFQITPVGGHKYGCGCNSCRYGHS
jgi:hypothetical protein